MRVMVVAVVVATACSSSASQSTDGANGDSPVPVIDAGIDVPGPDHDIAPTLLAVGANGELAARALEPPWAQFAVAQLGAPVVSARFYRGYFYFVQPDAIRVVDGNDLSSVHTFALPGADARDIVFLDHRTAIASLRALDSLARIDLATREVTTISLAALSPQGSLDMLTACAARVFVQVQRQSAPGLGVIDILPTSSNVVGTIPLAYPPRFDMHADCGAQAIDVAAHMPLMEGGGEYERVDLATQTAQRIIGEINGEVGGFVVSGPNSGWYVMHTEFGPSPSSHVDQFTPTGMTPIYTTFAPAHIDRFAMDVASSQLFFPESCTVDCFPNQPPGVHVFDLVTAAHQDVIDPGFAPIHVVTAR